MSTLSQLPTPTEAELVVAFFDLSRYARFARSQSPQETFAFISDYYEFVGDIIERDDGLVVKFIGDAGLVVYPADCANQAVLHLKQLKEAVATIDPGNLNELLFEDDRIDLGEDGYQQIPRRNFFVPGFEVEFQSKPLDQNPGVSRQIPNYDIANPVVGVNTGWPTRSANVLGFSWKKNTVYPVGRQVVFSGHVYRCDEAHTSGGAFGLDAAKWSKVHPKITFAQPLQNFSATNKYFVNCKGTDNMVGAWLQTWGGAARNFPEGTDRWFWNTYHKTGPVGGAVVTFVPKADWHKDSLIDFFDETDPIKGVDATYIAVGATPKSDSTKGMEDPSYRDWWNVFEKKLGYKEDPNGGWYFERP